MNHNRQQRRFLERKYVNDPAFREYTDNLIAQIEHHEAQLAKYGKAWLLWLQLKKIYVQTNFKKYFTGLMMAASIACLTFGCWAIVTGSKAMFIQSCLGLWICLLIVVLLNIKPKNETYKSTLKPKK